MSSLENRIESINQRVQQLIAAHQATQLENTELKETVVRLSRELNTKESIISNFNTELEARQKESASADKNMQIREELDGYMKEVDACIEMVNELV